jgi:hypothetical protein
MSHEMNRSREILVQAFPRRLHDDVRSVISLVSEERFSSSPDAFTVRVDNQQVSIPCRIYYEPTEFDTAALSNTSAVILDCLLTRHNSGFIRQKHLQRILILQHSFVPAFVVALVGEYVLEIHASINDALPHLDRPVYSEFVRSNLEFLALTEQRVISYWNCYYRDIKKENYPAFLALNFLKSLQNKKPL